MFHMLFILNSDCFPIQHFSVEVHLVLCEVLHDYMPRRFA